ncbi:MAG: hypothetical protein ACYS14_08320 [Planctomycetota bacterium]|jgi:hypothetical protein
MYMKLSRDTLRLFALACALLSAGCQNQSPTSTNNGPDGVAPCTQYAPERIDIPPLTEYIPADQAHRPRIDLYVSLLDPFGSQVKAPGVFRFELYEHVQRSAQPKGKRVAMWPDVDLTDPLANNEYWLDFLRAYQFTLPLDHSDANSHILQVTYLCPSGKLLTSEFTVRRNQ